MENPESLPISNPHSCTRPPNNSCTNFVRRLILAIVLLFITISTISSVARLVLDPSDPVFQLNSLSISNFTFLDSKLTANYEIKLDVINPNHNINLFIQRLDICLGYQRTLLSKTSMQSFEVGKKSRKAVSAELETDHLGSLLNESMNGDIGGELRKRVVSFEVRMMVLGKYMAGVWSSNQRSMEVYCGNVKVEFSSARVTGKLMNGRRDCLVI